MPTTDVTGAERDALREQILTRVSGIDDLRMACQAEDFERARHLGMEFGDMLRLMEDLGWSPETPSLPIGLTMPPGQLHRTFTRLQGDAERMRADEDREETEVRNEAEIFRERAQRVTDACERVLSAMGPDPA